MKKFNLITNQNALVKSAVVPVNCIYGTLKIPAHKKTRPVDYILWGFQKMGNVYFPVVSTRSEYLNEDLAIVNKWSKPIMLRGTCIKNNPFYVKVAKAVSEIIADNHVKPEEHVYNVQNTSVTTHKICASIGPKDRIIPTPIYHCGYMSPNTGTEDMEVVRYGFDGEIYNNLTPRAKKFNCGKRHD